MTPWPGFTARRLPGARDDVAIHAQVGGEGPPLLLLHGFPQTHLAWRHVAPPLAARFTVVAADLRGYGDSSAPADDPAHETYAKRAMGADMVSAMAALGHSRFHVAGHDRGGRVAYRLALERPDMVDRLAVLEIAPTLAMWRAFDAGLAHKAWHWSFLAQPAPLPERLIGADPAFFLDHMLRAWSRDGGLDAFDGALDAYRAAFSQPARIAAFCADYRAGFGPDRAADAADLAAGRTIAAPTLLIAGPRGFPAATGDAAAHWRAFAPDLRVATADCGHFPMEEDPAAVAASLLAHLSQGA